MLKSSYQLQQDITLDIHYSILVSQNACFTSYHKLFIA